MNILSRSAKRIIKPNYLAYSSRSTFATSPFKKHDLDTIDDILKVARNKDADQPEYIQAVEEIVEDLEPVFERNPEYRSIFRVSLEPERVIKFRVPWIDQQGNLRVNRGYRVQFSGALGPYKGGLRFHPTVNESILKFLGFEQIFKNALTGLSLGGAKGGSDFNPKGRTEAEVMAFCQSFMTELSHFIGGRKDVPAGDIGVGGREIGYMFGQFRRMNGYFGGVLTGKGSEWGGSNIRPEATGYGCVYYAVEAFGGDISGKKCVVSGAGNVATFLAEKLLDLGATPLTFSDSGGYIFCKDGFNKEQVNKLMELKADPNARVQEMTKLYSNVQFFEGEKPWKIPCDVAFPCATQNEVSDFDAKALCQNGCKGIFEGANMPSTHGAIKVYQQNKIIYGPGKAANAGGVAVSGLEMSQNAQMAKWTRTEVDERLKGIMKHIYKSSCDAAEEYGMPGNLKAGANIAGFQRLAAAVQAQGF